VRTSGKGVFATTCLGLMCLGLAACGKGVTGHTYADGGGMVKIEFQSGGKAITTMGPITASCTYTQSSNQVTLTCADQATVLALGSDGSLSGPPDGMLNKLTKVN
jgi:hypothetical protein